MVINQLDNQLRKNQDSKTSNELLKKYEIIYLQRNYVVITMQNH
ncbi:hypothetical protein Phpb_01731 [Photorhabdus namnaonensis]|uniref:Uncharacterized protein n=1 Tax=Photorhabdus namnaonensis TaxID=1851568 RepID=A0A1B8YJ38_9GAMM|nr:hypothetical protein Phpb_01731 [Photorhabdus namnaonensis]